MKPASFDYIVADSASTAVGVLASREDAKLLAGGQSLVPMMNLRLARPSVLVDLNRLAELEQISVNGDHVRLGALCRHRRLELDPELARTAPLLTEAAGLVSHPAVRNRGTLGGSLAHADPAAEYGAVALAYDAEIGVLGPLGQRAISADEFFEGFLTTTLAEDEMITEVVLPVAAPGEGAAFCEFAPRHGDFALVGVAARLRIGPGGRVELARAAASGVQSRPVLLHPVTGLVGSGLTDDDVGAAANDAAAAIDPVDDVHAPAVYRRELLHLLTARALGVARDRARIAQEGDLP